MSLNILFPPSLNYKKLIKLLKRTKMSRLTLTGPNFPLQCELRTVSCQKPVACAQLSEASPLLWKCFGMPGHAYLLCHSQQDTDISAVMQVSRDSRKRSGRGLCQTIYRKCAQFSLQNIVIHCVKARKHLIFQHFKYFSFFLLPSSQ